MDDPVNIGGMAFYYQRFFVIGTESVDKGMADILCKDYGYVNLISAPSPDALFIFCFPLQALSCIYNRCSLRRPADTPA